MKTKLKLFQAPLLCAVALGISRSFSLAVAAEELADPAPAKASIPWSQLGAKAGVDYQGDGLALSPTAGGARLRCVFQRLEGEATREGLWLTSTVTNGVNDRFRVVAADMRRLTPTRNLKPETQHEIQSLLTSAATDQGSLPRTGTVQVADKLVRFTRPGVIEEYSVSMDGVRQDFIIEHPPLNSQLSPLNPRAGELAVRLAVSGANVEPAACGAQLVLENSGRRIAYSRLRVIDATGKELTARMEVLGSDGESQRDSIAQPGVASPRATLGQAKNESTTLKGLHYVAHPHRDQQCDATPLGLEINSGSTPRVARWTRNPGLTDTIPSGLLAEGRTPMLLVLVNDTDAVYPMRIDPTFSDANWISMGGIPGANGHVEAAVVDGSGNFYIGGRFTVVGDVIANYIAKWNGTSWSALGSGMNEYGVVSALAVSGSDLYAGGCFTSAGDVAASGVAKWDGTSWSALGSGMNDCVSALAVSGNILYALGYFTTAGGSAANHIAKWNGSSWSALGSGLHGNLPYLFALAVSGSDVYAGGIFTTAGSVAVNNIARWNGSSWSALGSGMNFGGSVFALAVSGSDLYAGGQFTTAGGSPANAIAKWNGSSWSALGSGLAGEGAPVLALAVSGSDLYAGGQFTTAGGSPANGIAKWNGSGWSALGLGMNYGVFALAVSGNKVYAGGAFTTAGGSGANYVAKWDGDSWSTLGSGIGAQNGVSALAVSGSDLYVGGDFRTAGGGPANYIAKWNGSSWSALGSGMNNSVSALAVSGSDLYAGGAFTNAGGSAANYVAKWNGSSWSALGSGIGGGPDGYSPNVYALTMSGGDLYAGGLFTTAGGSAANYIAKWNGSSWSALGSGMRGDPDGYYPNVSALAVSGSNLYAGGVFTNAGGSAASNIAKWDGSSWSALGSGISAPPGDPYYGGWVTALAVSDSNVYAGGEFRMAGGSAATNIAKWDGSGWSALGSGMNDPVLALAVSGSDVYAGGWFTMAGASAANSIAKWNGSIWTPLGSGMDRQVSALAVSGSDLLAGGGFTMAGGKVSAYLARAIVNPPVLAIEGDGGGGYFIRFSGVPGSAYRLQRAPGLSGPWTAIGPQTVPASGLVEFWDLFPPPGQGIYRSVQP